MPDIRIHRDHSLGFAKARKTAFQWAESVEEKFEMECTVIEGDDRDVVEFTRSGVDGTLVVTADSIDIEAKLGFLLGAFRGKIESEIEGYLDELLAKGAAKAATKPKAKKQR